MASRLPEKGVHKPKLSLQHSESVVVEVASRIYAAYIAAGRVPEGQQNQWMQRSIEEALRLAFTVDEVVHSDEEMG